MEHDHTTLRFERFSLDLKRGSFHVGDAEVELRPKSFLVLKCLAENAGTLMSKDMLFQTVWNQRVVGDDSLVQCIRELRDKLGDGEHRLIKTIPKRGYMLDAMRLPGVDDARTGSEAAVEPAVTSKPEKAPPKQFAGRHLLRWAAAGAGLLFAALTMTLGLLRGWSADRPDGAAEGQPRTAFRHCADCPEMLALPTGEFLMGSSVEERGRLNDEGEQRPVRISKPFAIGRFEVTVEQFEAFLNDTGLAVENTCRVLSGWQGNTAVLGGPATSFRAPSHPITPAHPVGCIGWHEAQAYVAWLRRKTGKPYRLPSEAEWEYAARAGTKTAYSFGSDPSQLCEHARFADLDSAFNWRNGCRSGVTERGSLPVGSFKPNPWGLFDVHGNVWEWTEDCWSVKGGDTPTDGSPFVRPGNCDVGVLRGGSWITGTTHVRSAMRMPMRVNIRNENVGFRVSLSLDEPPLRAMATRR